MFKLSLSYYAIFMPTFHRMYMPQNKTIITDTKEKTKDIDTIMNQYLDENGLNSFYV